MKNILVTGGTGFIGSHTCTLLLRENYNVIILDSLVNSSSKVIEKIKNLGVNGSLYFYRKDLREDLETIFEKHKVDIVIHFAGLKSVNNSIMDPLEYYSNNLVGTINLLKTMNKFNCNNLIFSSSATVYGNTSPPLKEEDKVGQGITNPYGQTKYMLEKIMMDYCKSNSKNRIVSLRYFNPIGAHPSGELGESPNDKPNNLMPHVVNVAYKNFKKDNNITCSYLPIYGNDYITKDGTCIRDYIHVMDVAESHILGIKKIENMEGYNVINIGLGKGTSVLEL